MSGDLGPRVVIAAAIHFVATFPEVELLLVGDQDQIQALLSSNAIPAHPAIRVLHAPDVVAMHEDPLSALRHKKNSSMWQALLLVQNGAADACVSAGNTGALMAISKYLLKTFPGIDRPAICKSLPVEQSSSYMLDLGANLTCTAEQLHQFALMGSVLAASSGISEPTVALLNVGVEETKGTEVIRRCHELLSTDKQLNYVGFMESDAIFFGRANVIVCDGFAGNVALKSSEGVARLIAQKIQKSFARRWYLGLLAIFMRPLLQEWRRDLNPGAYNGASFLGLQKPVVKSHGSADEHAFYQALSVAMEQVVQKVPARIQDALSAASKD
jgi:fatty acid/phospholipid synthesis protein PlsX